MLLVCSGNDQRNAYRHHCITTSYKVSRLRMKARTRLSSPLVRWSADVSIAPSMKVVSWQMVLRPFLISRRRAYSSQLKPKLVNTFLTLVCIEPASSRVLRYSRTKAFDISPHEISKSMEISFWSFEII